MLKSDGKPGLVELTIPASELTGRVSAVKIGWFHERDVRFDLLETTHKVNVIRFVMPDGHSSVRIHSGAFDPYGMPILLANLMWPMIGGWAFIEYMRDTGARRVKYRVKRALGLKG